MICGVLVITTITSLIASRRLAAAEQSADGQADGRPAVDDDDKDPMKV